MTQCDGQHGGYRKREIVFVVTKKGNLAAYNKRTEKIEYLEITNRGKLKYIGAEKKYVEKFQRSHATAEFLELYDKKYSEIMNKRKQRKREKPEQKEKSESQKLKRKSGLKRCPRGQRRDLETGECVSSTEFNRRIRERRENRKRCPRGQRRDFETGECVTNEELRRRLKERRDRRRNRTLRSKLNISSKRKTLKSRSSISSASSPSPTPNSKSSTQDKSSSTIQTSRKSKTPKSKSAKSASSVLSSKKELTPGSITNLLYRVDHDKLRHIGIRLGDFYDDVCMTYNKMKKASLLPIKVDEDYLVIHNLMPYLKTSTSDGKKHYYKNVLEDNDTDKMFLYFGKNDLTMHDLITSGSYGSIYQAVYDNKEIIVKLPTKIYKRSQSYKIYSEILKDHYLETFLHIETFCRTRGELSSGKYAKIPKPVLLSRFIRKGFQNLTKKMSYEIPIMGMQQMDNSLTRFLSHSGKNILKLVSLGDIFREKFTNDFIRILFKVANTLSYLQKKFGFVHRDLHMGNVMYNVNTKKDIDVFIIDFGMATLISDGERLNKLDNGLYNDFNENHSGIKCHDLRMLLYSVWGSFKNVLKEFLYEEIYYKFLNIINEIKANLDKNAVPYENVEWHRCYKYAIQVSYIPILEPDNFICFMQNDELISEYIKDL